jgi:hypothetical protein
MSHFRIWGTINQTAPAHFLVVVSAVRDPPKFSATADVRTADAASRQDAEQLQEKMMIELGAEVRARGDRIVDVEA